MREINKDDVVFTKHGVGKVGAGQGRVMADVESIWTEARNRRGQFGDRRTPSAGIAAVLLALWRYGSMYGAEIAQHAKQNQGNTALWLTKLRRFEFVEINEVVHGYGHQGGGRPAVFWSLTRAGRELAELLEEGRVAA